MKTIVYYLDGQEINLNLRYTAKRNIILRKQAPQHLLISLPPWLSDNALHAWLKQNHARLHQILASPHRQPTSALPKQIWFRGQYHRIEMHPSVSSVVHHPHQLVFQLPSTSFEEQKKLLRTFFIQEARLVLLPRLIQHSHTLNLFPAAVELTHAKGFWGVCRKRTGIRLNWRLIGAPDEIIDYVCIHELCHLREPNHSSRFWDWVHQFTPHTESAKLWLKQNGSELFCLD